MNTICPNCFKAEPEGTLFCPECGTEMDLDNGVFTEIVNLNEINSDFNPATGKASYNNDDTQDNQSRIRLQIVDTGQILPLVDSEEHSIGRVSKGQSIHPDINLTPFGAFARGVSRLHAIIKVNEDEIVLIDLGSANGTRLNKEEIRAHKEYKLKDGDEIKLGKLKFHVLLRDKQDH